MTEQMIASLLSATHDTTAQPCNKPRVHSRKQQPCNWFDSRCRAALKEKEAVYKDLHSTTEQKQVAEKKFHSLADRIKEQWTCQRNEELCDMAAKGDFWKVFKKPLSNTCPVELTEQLEAFRRLMGAEPPPAPTRPGAPGVSTPGPDNACLYDDVTLVELSACIKRIFNCILASHFPERLSIGLITAVYNSGDRNNMSNYRGITVGSVIAKLFAMILEQRIASWAEKQGVKAKGQAGFRKDFRTTDNIFILRSLIDKQRRTRQKGKS